MQDKKASKQIDALGGTAATATMSGISQAAISQWRKFGIPKARLQFLQLSRPDIFKKPATKRTKRKARAR